MKIELEHANLCVRDVEAMTQFLQTAFPEFKVRGGGVGKQGAKWLHFGTDTTYIALSEATQETEKTWKPYSGAPGVNHLAFVVDDVNSLEKRMIEAGYFNSTVSNAHPHRKRVYFNDPEGNDWEFVQYYSDDPAERNDYTLPDA
jgi:catechol-2,3-dioxygenase